jgi:SAM-dependent methyltransferase
MRVTKCIVLVCLLVCGTGAATEERTGGPFVPTPQAVVDEMLKLANVRKGDYVVDLGSGDGRIVLTAARRFQARGMGVEIDGELVDQSNAAAQREGLDRLVRFEQRDVLQTPLGEASVLTLYLLPNMMSALRSKILSEMKPGARVVSHDFEFGDWEPERKLTVDAPDKYGAGNQLTSNIMLWVVPARVEGAWQIAFAGGMEKPYTVTLRQKFQHVEGAAQQDGKRVELKSAKLEGKRIRFVLQGAAPRAAAREFQGTVEGDQIRGEVTLAQGVAHWTATRAVAAARSR